MSKPGEMTDVLLRLRDDGHVTREDSIPHADYVSPSVSVRTARRSTGTRLPFAQAMDWTVTTTGEIATMIGDRYAVDVHRKDGSVLRMSRAIEPVEVTEIERQVERDRVTTFMRRAAPQFSWQGPAIPSIKAPIRWLHAGLDGRLWVRTSQPGRIIPVDQRPGPNRSYVQEPTVFDVFEPDGAFVGVVTAPDELQLFPHPVFRGDFVWAVVHGEDGLNQVVRYRIVGGTEDRETFVGTRNFIQDAGPPAGHR